MSMVDIILTNTAMREETLMKINIYRCYNLLIAKIWEIFDAYDGLDHNTIKMDWT